MAGCTVTLVDIPGTYKDMPGGPFAGGKTIERPDYRMLAAIIESPEAGSYFLKLYGPAATIAQHADGFRKMIEGLVPATK
jgi:gluconolactonase